MCIHQENASNEEVAFLWTLEGDKELLSWWVQPTVALAITFKHMEVLNFILKSNCWADYWRINKGPLILLCQIISVECPTNFECALVSCHLKLIWSLNFEIVLRIDLLQVKVVYIAYKSQKNFYY